MISLIRPLSKKDSPLRPGNPGLPVRNQPSKNALLLAWDYLGHPSVTLGTPDHNFADTPGAEEIAFVVHDGNLRTSRDSH